MANITQQSTFYAFYKDNGFSWNIAIWAILLNIVGITGQISNAAVIFVTIRTKALHGTANFHLSLGAFFEILHQNGHLLFLYITLSGQNFLTYRTSIYFLTLAIFGLGSVALSITFTALDRLICVLFPMMAHKLNPIYYLPAVVIICLGFSARNVFSFYQMANIIPDVMITGSFDDVLSQVGDAKEIYNNSSLAFNCATFVIYVVMGLVIKFKHKPMSGSGSNRIYKSIFVLITVNLSGFCAMRIYRLFIAGLIKDFMTRWYIGEAMSVYLNMSTASTGFILYLTSKDYRNAFKKEIFNKIGGCKTTITAVSTVQNPTILINRKAIPKRDPQQNLRKSY